MSPKKESIGQEELSILRFIQDNHPVTVREVASHFAKHGKARTTILTVMERLRQKKFLTRKKVGSAFCYSPRQAQDAVMNTIVGEFVNNMLGGSLSPFMAYLSQANNLSDGELDELKQLVKELSKERKEKNK